MIKGSTKGMIFKSLTETVSGRDLFVQQPDEGSVLGAATVPGEGHYLAGRRVPEAVRGGR